MEKQERHRSLTSGETDNYTTEALRWREENRILGKQTGGAWHTADRQ